MKKRLLFVLLCFGLVMPGSGLINNANAQTRGQKTSLKSTDGTKKIPSPAKKSSLQNIMRERKAGNLVEGDPCNQSTPITLGQTLNGTLAAGDCAFVDGTFIDFYSFHGTSGQAIYVSMNSAAFDTYLYLLDDEGDPIDENDDSGPDTNSRIPIDGGVITLPYTGDYFIGANSFDPATGSYTVSLQTDAACAATPITYNQTVNGTLTNSDCAVNIGDEPYYTDIYTFNGTAGQQISIAMNSSAVDAYLVYHTPSGAGSLEDNDSGGGTNARIPTSGLLTLTQNGTYTIEASTFNSFEVGSYTLTLTGPTVAPTSAKPFDFDGDGKTDLSVFRPADSVWWYQKSSNNQVAAAQFGNSTDKLAPADFTGDGKTDIAIWRPSTGEWFILRSEDFSFFAFPFGANGDVPVPGDYDGDHKADAAVFRPSDSTWYIRRSSDTGATIVTFGTTGDVPVAADYDGDGKTDIAIYRPSVGQWWLSRSTAGLLAIQFGAATDKPVQGDYTGDAKADVAFWHPSTGEWFILRSEDFSFYAVPFGIATDLPTPGDYDGDGKYDTAVFRPSDSTWYVNRSTAGTLIQTFGIAGDRPVPNAFVP